MRDDGKGNRCLKSFLIPAFYSSNRQRIHLILSAVSKQKRMSCVKILITTGRPFMPSNISVLRMAESM